MLKRQSYCFLILSLLFVVSCRKDINPSWDTDLLFPIAKTSLTINQIFPDSLVKTNLDNSFTLVYQNPVYVFDPTTIEEFPDTTLTTSYMNPFFTIQYSANQEIINKTEETRLNIKNIELNYLILKSGKTEFEITSTINYPTEIIYSLPKVTKNGQAFSITITVPGGIPSQPGIFKGEFDLTGYAMDLKGSGAKVNTIETSFIVKVPVNVPVCVVNAGEGIILKNTLSEIKPYYAKGYFGTNLYKSGPVESDFSFLNKVESGTIAFEDMNVDLTFKNGIGVDATVKLNKLASYNSNTAKTVTLNHAIVGNPINLNRAVDNLWGSPEVKPSERVINFTTSNSNFKALVENLPDKITGDFDIHFNPLGNISGGNDFLHADYGFSVLLDFEMPLSFQSNKLTLVDTIAIDLSENDQRGKVRKGQLTILAENSFPFDASVSILMLDEHEKIIGLIKAEDMNIIRAGLIDSKTKMVETETSSRVVYLLDEEYITHLFDAKKLVLKSTFTTIPQGSNQKIYSHYKLGLKLTAKIQYLTKID